MRILVLALAGVLIAFTVASPHPRARPAARHGSRRPAPSPSPITLDPAAILSRRAMQRARLLIQLRMLELRDERLTCVRQAILRRLPPDLLASLGTPPPTRAGSACRRRAPEKHP